MPNPNDMQHCIDECRSCHETCVRTFAHVLQAVPQGLSPVTVRYLVDCAAICATSADFMLRGSELHVHTCAACAEVCQRCAEECGRARDDASLRECAQTCQRCAESCRRMAAAHV